MTDELTARANRAAERPPAGPGQTAGREATTEVLDQSLLPDEEDEGTKVEDPVEKDRRKKETAVLQGAEKRAAEKAREEARKQAEKEREEARKRAEKARPREAARPEEVRKAENLLESFLAAHQRSKDSPKKEAKPPPPPAPPPPQAAPVSLPPISEAAPRVSVPASAMGPSLPPPPGPGGVMYALNQAQPPGVFFVEVQGEESEDPALAAAVDETIGALFGVRGIHHIGPGHNEAGEPVVVIAAGQDFGEAAMKSIPETVGNFRTLLTLPYDLLPLRRNR